MTTATIWPRAVTPMRGLPWAFLFLLTGLGASARADTFDDVTRLAEGLARAPYRAPPPPDPALAALSYDDYRQLRFRPEQALWSGGSLFDLQFFPLGRGNSRALELYEVEGGKSQPIDVPASWFRTDGGPGRAVGGAAGWRLHFPLNNDAYRDELIAFLGSSYFRALGAGQRYGLSARGLAVDTVGGRGEEFPAFTRFWFERPAPGTRLAVVHALLESPRVAGAYRFEIRPGATTRVDVRARLFLRAPVATLGLAPLTSMYLGGENQPPIEDYRPEVHDSDGLQIAAGDGEWLWRPLTNPRGVFVSSFALRSPRGFGLMQRDRAFSSYEDLEAQYERRPSVWVEPLGDWGAGRVELMQFHTPDETHDNVVAYWVPAVAPKPGERFELGWRLNWSGADAVVPPLARVQQSRVGFGYRERAIDPARQQFHLDFAGPGLETCGDGAAPIEAVASGNDNVRNLRAIAYPNPARGGCRVTLDFERVDRTRTVELRAFLRRGGHALSETWSYAMAAE